MKHLKVCSDSEPRYSENDLFVRRAELDFFRISSLSLVGHVQTERCSVCNHHNETGGRSWGQ